MADEEQEVDASKTNDVDTVNDQSQWYQYAAKVVCGDAEPRGPVAPGHYYTAINVHNPENCRTISFKWKVTVALPGKPGPVSRFVDAKLGPDESLEIDCPEIRKLAQFDGRFLKGFVVLQSPEKLDVVAVYTAARRHGDEPIQTMDVERVHHSHRFKPCRPLDITLDTGIAAWKVDAPGPASFRNVVPVTPISTAWTAPATATWVADSATATAPGTYRYLFEFNLNPCFKSGQLTLNEIWADNDIERVSLNNNDIPLSVPLPAQNNFDGSPPVSGSTTVDFKPGKNVLRVRVHNEGGPTGLSIHGRIFVEDGICD